MLALVALGLVPQMSHLGCARFPDFLQNFTERQILWSLCLVVFLAFALKLPVQTSLSLSLFVFRWKMRQVQENEFIPGETFTAYYLYWWIEFFHFEAVKSVTGRSGHQYEFTLLTNSNKAISSRDSRLNKFAAYGTTDIINIWLI